MSEYAKKLGQRLLELRRERGLTQLDVAADIGIEQSRICYYESGRHCPTIDMTYRLARYYGVSIDWIAGLSERRDGSHADTEEDKG